MLTERGERKSCTIGKPGGLVVGDHMRVIMIILLVDIMSKDGPPSEWG